MKTALHRMTTRICILLFVFAFSMGMLPSPCLSASAISMVKLQGQSYVPEKAIANSKWIGRLPSNQEISMTFSLPLRNEQELDKLLDRIYDPNDPLYGRYLTSQQFTDQFGPTQADYDMVAQYAMGQGFKIVKTYPNRTILDVSSPTATVETAFNLHLQNYQAQDGRNFHAPDNAPQVPNFIASRIAGVIGLDDAAVWHSHSRLISAANVLQTSPNQIGTGPGGGLTPSDIKKAYNLNGLTANGSGQILGLFELDGYTSSDVARYVSYYGLRSVPLQNVLIDGFSGRAGSGASEVTLDIELQIALAPGASRIIVYEGPNTNTGVIHTYNRIATDNLAKQISTSWGLSEGQSNSTILNSENTAFKQMAAQGQSIYAAAGDSGAYDNGSTISVDDPASQPYMVGVGGTQLFVNSDESYNYETTWNVNNTIDGGAGGGGVSIKWPIPSWQQGIGSAVSATMRNVPDVSLNSDQYTGYSIYYKNAWYIFGGTSCASPLWAAFTACVNQVRTANSAPTLGFANPLIYQISTGANYGADFHDIADGSTNLYYVAGTGYDNATGWGSFNGANLFADLTGVTPTPPNPPTGLTAVGGNAIVTLNWNASTGATSYNVYRGTVSEGESATPMATGITGTSYTDNTVTNGIPYYYKVSATNSAGTSALSTEASATPTLPPPPNPPTGLKATAGNGAVSLTWTASTGAASYNVYRGTVSGGEGTTPIATGITGTSYTDNTVTNGVPYYYQVSATNSTGTSALSNEASATPTAPSLIITSGPTATASMYSATIKWNTNLASNSVVKYGTNPSALSKTSTNSRLVTSHSMSLMSLSRRTTYYYQVSSSAGSATASSAILSFKTQ